MAGLLPVNHNAFRADASVLDQLWCIFPKHRFSVAVSTAVSVRVCSIYFSCYSVVTRYAEEVDEERWK